jgi:hypothetical protein
MTDSSLLERTLSDNLSWNKARIKFLAAFLIALTQTRTVNLVRVAAHFGGRAKPSSSYKRIQRFLRLFDLPLTELAHLLIRLMKLTTPFVIVIDRTEWKFGSTWHNILTLSVASEQIAVPVLWRFLKRKGCSGDGEREAIMRDFLRMFAAADIQYVCADREFASVKWLEFLTTEKIPYRLRIKANHELTDKRGKAMKAQKLLQTARAGEAVICRRWRKLWGKYRVCVTGRKRADGELLILISNEPSPEMLAEYRLRWQIETLFGCLKSRGFGLEETHLQESERLEKLLGLLALAVCWSWLAGDKVCQRKPITTKNHGRGAKSVFRVGLDYLEQVFRIGSLFAENQERKEFTLILSCT